MFTEICKEKNEVENEEQPDFLFLAPPQIYSHDFLSEDDGKILIKKLK